MKYIRLEVYPDGKIVRQEINRQLTDSDWLDEYFHFYPSGDYEDMVAYGTVCLVENEEYQLAILKEKVLEQIEEKVNLLAKLRKFAKNLYNEKF